MTDEFDISFAKAPRQLSLDAAEPDSIVALFNDSRQIFHVSPDGTVVIDIAEDDLEAMADSGDQQVKPYALLLCEIMRLRERIQHLDDYIKQECGSTVSLDG